MSVPVHPHDHVEYLTSIAMNSSAWIKRLARLEHRTQRCSPGQAVLVAHDDDGQLVLLDTGLQARLEPVELVLGDRTVSSDHAVARVQAEQPDVLTDVGCPEGGVVVEVLLRPAMTHRTGPATGVFEVRGLAKSCPCSSLRSGSDATFEPADQAELLATVVQGALQRAGVQRHAGEHVQRPGLE